MTGGSHDERSPVTGGRTRRVDALSADVIVERYRAAGIKVDRYLAAGDEVEVRECLDTGYRYFPAATAGEADFYEQLYDPDQADWQDPDYRHTSEDYDWALGRLGKDDELLDVGCGYGYFLEQARNICRVQGLDGNSHAVARCRAQGLEVELGSIESVADKWKGRFDVVTGFQILEHVADVRSFMTAMVAVVKPGGRLILAVPNNEPFIRRFDRYNTFNCPPHHVGLWNLSSLRAMAGRFGLELVDHAYSEVSGRPVVDAYLRARDNAGITSEIGAHSLAEKVRIAARMPFLLPASLLTHVRRKGLGTRNVIAVELRRR